MSVERTQQTISASGVIQLPRGNFFLLLQATASVNIRSQLGGSSEGFNGVSGGTLIKRVEPWDFIEIFGVAGTVVQWLDGLENVIEDLVDVRLAATTISGSVSINAQPSTTIEDNAAVAAADAAQSALFAANAARRRLRVTADSNNLGSCYVRTVGGANNLLELQPGTYHEFHTIDGAEVRNDTGGVATFYIFEES